MNRNSQYNKSSGNTRTNRNVNNKNTSIHHHPSSNSNTPTKPKHKSGANGTLNGKSSVTAAASPIKLDVTPASAVAVAVAAGIHNPQQSSDTTTTITDNGYTYIYSYGPGSSGSNSATSGVLEDFQSSDDLHYFGSSSHPNLTSLNNTNSNYSAYYSSGGGNGNNKEDGDEWPLEKILNEMKQKYGSATGTLHGATSFPTDAFGLDEQNAFTPSVTESNFMYNNSMQHNENSVVRHKLNANHYHHLPVAEERSQEKVGNNGKEDKHNKGHISCKLCKGRRHFDPLGEVYFSHRSLYAFKHSVTSAHEQFRSSMRTNSSNLIHSVLPTEIDSLMRQNGHISTKKSIPLVLADVIRNQVFTGSQRESTKFTFSYTSSSNREALLRQEMRGAAELAHFVGVLSHEMSLEQFAAAEADVFRDIFKLIHSNDPVKKIAGVRAIDALILVHSSDEDKKTIKFANNLSNALRVGGNYEFLSTISITLGKMARKGNADYVEFEVTRGIEWLRTDKSERRLAAVLTLRELAINAPTSFYSKTNQLNMGGSNEFLECIIPILRDPVPLVRTAAADALAECIKLIIRKSHRSKTSLLCKLHTSVMEGLVPSRRTTAAALGINEDTFIHGSLLCAGVLLEHTMDFMLPRFDEICDEILPLTSHANTNAMIRLAVIHLIPKLANRCPGVFGRRFLKNFLRFLLQCSKSDQPGREILDERPAALLAIGKLALEFKSSKNDDDYGRGIFYFLEEIFDAIRVGLQRKTQGQLDTTIEALRCASDIVEATADRSSKHIPDLLDHMLKSGLSDSLIHSLRVIAASLPSIQPLIQERILQEISFCLAGTNEVFALVDPLRKARTQSNALIENRVIPTDTYALKRSSKVDWKENKNYKSKDMFLSTKKMSMENKSEASNLPCINISMSLDSEIVRKVVLSLRTLGTLGNREKHDENYFSMLLLFVRNVAIQYLSHPKMEVRKEAALTCCLLLLPKYVESSMKFNENSGGRFYFGRSSYRVVEEVLRKLLQVAVSDPSPSVRLCVVGNLDSRYISFLCQGHHVQPLFLLLQDEISSIREAALKLLGQLALHNPTLVLPYLRKMVMDLIIELRCGGESSGVGKQSTTVLLIILLRSEALNRIVHPFLPSIIEALPLKEASPRLSAAALECLGELAIVAKDSMCPWIPELMPIILETMQDQSSASKQRTSFKILGQLVEGTGYVILPYLDYPQLLPLATSILPSAKRSPWILRREIMRTFGLIGALDPQRYNSMIRRSSKVRRTGRVGGGLYIDADDEDTYGSSQSRDDFNTGSNSIRRQLEDGNGDSEPVHLSMYELYAMTAQPISKILPPRRLIPSDEEFYPTIVVQALTRILKDNSLLVHHGMVMQAIMFVFNALGLRCVPFLKQIVPHILSTIRTCGQVSLRDALIMQLASLSSIVRDHLRPYIGQIIDVIEEFWKTRHFETILLLVEKLAFAMPDDIRACAPKLVRQILKTFESVRISEWSATDIEMDSLRIELVLGSIRYLTPKGILSGHMHLIVPELVKLVDLLIQSSSSKRIASSTGSSWEEHIHNLTLYIFHTISIILTSTGSSFYFASTSCNGASTLSARAAQPLMRLLRESRPNLKIGQALIQLLCVCAKNLGGQWILLYDASAQQAIMIWENSLEAQIDEVGQISSSTSIHQYNAVVEQIMNRMEDNRKEVISGNVSQENNSITNVSDITVISPIHEGRRNKTTLSESTHLRSFQPSQLSVNQSKLQRAWDVSQRTSREDWEDWIKRFSVQVLREAPSPALRAAADLAIAYQPLARELFPAAFVCCWQELNEKYKTNLVQSLEVVFVADVSPDILQTLLNLAEFMEHDGIDGGLPIELSKLAALAEKCRAYSKALHYKEQEYVRGSGAACVDALISINKKLELPEAALGILNATQMKFKDDYPPSSSIVLRGPGAQLEHIKDITVKESWLAELGNWSQALQLYESKLTNNPGDVDAILGCMRCYDARGDWQNVLELAGRSWTALTKYSSVLTRKSSSNILSDTHEEDKVSDEEHKYVVNESHREAIKFCSKAAWSLGQWDSLETFASQLVRGKKNDFEGNNTFSKTGQARFESNGSGIPLIDFDGAFFSAILHINRAEWELAEDAIDAARRAMDSSFTALMSESYKRAYPSMVTAQTLSELEEIISFRKLETKANTGSHRHGPTKMDAKIARERLSTTWRKRMIGCRIDTEVHSAIMAVRSLVLGPADEVDATLQLSAISRQSKHLKLAEKILCDPIQELGGSLDGRSFGFNPPSNLNWEPGNFDPLPIHKYLSSHMGADSYKFSESQINYSHQLVKEAGGSDRLHIQHRLYYAYIKNLWLTGRCDEAVDRLSKLCDIVELVGHCDNLENSSLRVGCWLKLGEWKLSQKYSPSSFLPDDLQVDLLSAFGKATAAKNDDYRAWHSWGLINFRIAQQCIQFSTEHIITAVKAFVRAISLGTKRWSASVLQDMLNLLTCLFKFGNMQAVDDAINDGLKLISLECWLGCMPQLLARIHIKSRRIRSTLHSLLVKLGTKHPQALMYPLSVLLKSSVIERKSAAEKLMNSLKAHSNALVEEAELVSGELIRVAILWLELWHEGLEDASRLYFGDGNVSGMLDILLPLHEQLEKGPATRREIEFYEIFGRDLSEAHAYIREYMRLTEVIPTQGGFVGPNDSNPSVIHNPDAEQALNDAWDRYYIVFRKINKQIPSLTTLELNQVSPALQKAHKLELGVPGTYRVDGSYVKIESFEPIVKVITSKQRPRKLVIRGNDGKDYVFLLKGHEDLRQDERVMQLFGLVNALLARHRRTNRYELNIQRYVITPLSHHVGLVGWVPHTDTIHAHIRDYREDKKIILNTENREMMKLAPEYDLLPLLQKVEVFETALERATGRGMDLYEILFINSLDSEEWLERRTNYTRSLAVMSMVGYILGLGDRHPSNLMLDQLSGRVLHIDFGDCFEVAMHREKFPERVPFRLTRMLVNAMEVSGIEGSYRTTCENTMDVLRDNKDSLLAMLEAFVHDPLFSWRLLSQASNKNESIESKSSSSSSHTKAMLVNTSTSNALPSAIKEECDEIEEENISNTSIEQHASSINNINIIDSRRRGRSASVGVISGPHKAKSLKTIYSEIQSLAASLTTSSRIASLTGGKASVMGVSIAKSRLDKSVSRVENVDVKEEELNEKAVKVFQRVQDKLSGTDFPGPDGDLSPIDVEEQVELLIAQATSSENLCQLFIGWCAFW